MKIKKCWTNTQNNNDSERFNEGISWSNMLRIKEQAKLCRNCIRSE